MIETFPHPRAVTPPPLMPVQRHGHTMNDWLALTAAGVNPDTTQARDHAVPCHICRKPTFHKARGCDAHYVPPAAALKAVQA